MTYANRVTRISAPISKVVTLAEAKAHLYISHDDDDAIVAQAIDAATASIEGPNGAGIAMLDQTYRLSLDHFPATIPLPIWPVKEVSSITIKGETIDPEIYGVDTDSNPAVITTKSPRNSCERGSVKIEFVAGFGTASDVPADLKQAVLLLVGHFYSNREEVGDQKHTLPLGATTIINRYR